MAPYSDPKCKLFVGGLHHSTTDESLREYFQPFTCIEAKIARNQEGRSRGFAFVTFGGQEEVDVVQAQRPHSIDGREVDTTRVLPKEETGGYADKKAKKIFVAGIKGPIDEDEMNEIFAPFGNVLSVGIPVDRESGRQKGFCFVEFDDSDGVDKVICNKSDIQIHGNSVDIKKAFEKDSFGAGYNGARGRGGRGRGGSRGGYGNGSRGGYGGGYGGYDDYNSGIQYSYGGQDGYGGQGGYGRQSSYGGGQDRYGAPRGNGRGRGYGRGGYSKPSYENGSNGRSQGSYGRENDYENGYSNDNYSYDNAGAGYGRDQGY